MDSLPKDVLIYLLQFLNAESVATVNALARHYSLHAKSDLIWQRLTLEEFGTVNKTDINPVAASWFIVYRTFRLALNACSEHFYLLLNRKYRHKDDGEFDAILFRRPDKSMVIPDQCISPEQSRV
nr:hypothetical protein [Nitrosomonas sp.]